MIKKIKKTLAFPWGMLSISCLSVLCTKCRHSSPLSLRRSGEIREWNVSLCFFLLFPPLLCSLKILRYASSLFYSVRKGNLSKPTFYMNIIFERFSLSEGVSQNRH